ESRGRDATILGFVSAGPGASQVDSGGPSAARARLPRPALLRCPRTPSLARGKAAGGSHLSWGAEQSLARLRRAARFCIPQTFFPAHGWAAPPRSSKRRDRRCVRLAGDAPAARPATVQGGKGKGR